MTGALGKLGVGHLARVHHNLALARALAKRLGILVVGLGSVELLGAQRVRRDRRRIVHRADGRKHRARRTAARERRRGTACSHGDGDLRVRLILLRLHLEQIAEELAFGKLLVHGVDAFPVVVRLRLLAQQVVALELEPLKVALQLVICLP